MGGRGQQLCECLKHGVSPENAETPSPSGMGNPRGVEVQIGHGRLGSVLRPGFFQLPLRPEGQKSHSRIPPKRGTGEHPCSLSVMLHALFALFLDRLDRNPHCPTADSDDQTKTNERSSDGRHHILLEQATRLLGIAGFVFIFVCNKPDSKNL